MNSDTNSSIALTVAEVAEQLAVNKKTVIKWIEAGELRAFNVSAGEKNKSWRIFPRDLEAFQRGRCNDDQVNTDSETEAKPGVENHDR